MDMEQRIGRIHRYGQKDTAQVYNLVLSDTIEGSIFLLLTDKLLEIAKTLGKVDEHGNVTEDLRAQILGQLSDRLSYDQLYRDALTDPELRRTRQELEAAMSNANEARKVVYELFQDLDRFSLDDYKQFADIDDSKRRIVEFLRAALAVEGGGIESIDDQRMRLKVNGKSPMVCTLDRDLAQADESVELLGIDHRLMNDLLSQWQSAPADGAGATALLDLGRKAVLTIWLVQTYGRDNDGGSHLVPVAVDAEGKRIPALEKQYRTCFTAPSGPVQFSLTEREALLAEAIEPTLQRELGHRGIAAFDKGYSTKLVGWIEVS